MTFAADLDRLLPTGRIGLAVSGGADSLALLLLAAAARPGAVMAATVDHQLRPEGAAEGAMVGRVCARLGVPHFCLPVTVPAGASLQALARDARYAALGRWAGSQELSALATAHHADDQAETLLMRLARGSGVAGLAGIREQRELIAGIALIRPLLGWRKNALIALCEEAGLQPVADPANQDPRHDRTRARLLLADTDWIDPVRVARSAVALGEAEEALAWTADGLAAERIAAEEGGSLVVRADGLPPELQRRLVVAALGRLGAPPPRGPDLERALSALGTGGSCTLAGIRLSGGTVWRLAPAPPRTPTRSARA